MRNKRTTPYNRVVLLFLILKINHYNILKIYKSTKSNDIIYILIVILRKNA